MVLQGAGELFSLSDESEYVRTIVNKCVDEFARIRKQNAIKISGTVDILPCHFLITDARTRAIISDTAFYEDSVEVEELDPRLVLLVEQLFAQYALYSV